MNEDDKNLFVNSLKSIINQPNVLVDILETILLLAEFFDRHELNLRIETFLLTKISIRCESYSKSLRLAELEFIKNKDNVGDLIDLYTSLNYNDAAVLNII